MRAIVVYNHTTREAGRENRNFDVLPMIGDVIMPKNRKIPVVDFAGSGPKVTYRTWHSDGTLEIHVETGYAGYRD